jgi:hypothetical protein
MTLMETEHPQYDHTDIPPTLTSPTAVAFWMAVLLTGIGAGIAAAVLTWLLQAIEHLVWPGPNILEAGAHAGYLRHMIVLLSAGVVDSAERATNIRVREISSPGARGAVY